MDIRSLEISKETIIEDEKILLRYNDCVVFSSNNISIINGAKGSMKSTARDFLIRQLFNPEEGFKSDIAGSVLVIDTEMSKRLIQNNLNRFDGCDVRFFSLKGVAVAEMPLVLEEMIEKVKPEVLILDSSRDLLLNSNDPTESMKLINQLLYWSSQYKLHILNIVHSIKTEGGTKTKGTYGSELENKAESIISMSRTHAKAQVKCSFSRETLPFKPFTITLNEGNIPVKI